MCSLYSLDEMKSLHEKAKKFCSSAASKTSVNTIHRDKDEYYFTKIEEEHNNVMKVYEKDVYSQSAHGDPRSPINKMGWRNRLQGLFFQTCNPDSESVYGDTRIIFKADGLLQF